MSAYLPSRAEELGAAYQFQKEGLRASAIRFRIWICWTRIESASQPHRVAHCTACHAHRTAATPIAVARCSVCLAEEALGLATHVSSRPRRMPRPIQAQCSISVRRKIHEVQYSRETLNKPVSSR